MRNSLAEKCHVMLLYVVDSNGSSPGRRGFAMAVNDKAKMTGSIGGGIMEHKFVELAKERLHSADLMTLLRKQFHNKTTPADQSGMICSGDQTIVLQKINSDQLATVESILHLIRTNAGGAIQLSPRGLTLLSETEEEFYTFNYTDEDNWIYTEQLGFKNRMFIVGGGHCSLALSALMRNLDFHVSIFEERNGLNTFEENQSAHSKIVVGDYSQLNQHIDEGPNNYVIIMTFGYRTDDIALRSLAGKQFHYLGVLGSKSKMETLFESYRKENITDQFINSISTPAGLQIKSQTPWEIAVSIAAEIIQIKNREK